MPESFRQFQWREVLQIGRLDENSMIWKTDFKKLAFVNFT